MTTKISRRDTHPFAKSSHDLGLGSWVTLGVHGLTTEHGKICQREDKVDDHDGDRNSPALPKFKKLECNTVGKDRDKLRPVCRPAPVMRKGEKY